MILAHLHHFQQMMFSLYHSTATQNLLFTLRWAYETKLQTSSKQHLSLIANVVLIMQSLPNSAVTYRLESRKVRSWGPSPPSFSTSRQVPVFLLPSWDLAAGKAHFTKLSDAEMWWPGRTDARTQPTKGKTRERLDKWYRPAGSICDTVRKIYFF